MSNLSRFECVPCKGNEPKISDVEIAEYQPQVPDWSILEADGIKKLQRTFKFPDFAQALAFTNRVGQLAEQENHHPSILTEWGRVTITWWTHKIKGLHRNDFIMAARTDEAYSK
ncbi:MAG TPA: 4a-hydroxytetrahydrobiopterin dehydratase [Anaerolineaceae bacterium]|nr:4a-hydroxytetrahydrobiopterin dehydratase [Anaerolineaceae bacterium]